MSTDAAPLERGILKNLRYDFPAGVVVFLVALPLCLGIALASEAPLMSGLVTGVIGGLVVTLISRSSLSVSGPAAGLATIVAAGIAEMGSFESFLVAVVLAGVIQAGFGLLRGGFLAELFPLSVIKGMLAAIGIILILKQIPHALGRDHDFEGDLAFWTPGHEENTFTEIGLAIQTASPGVILVTGVALAILILWEQPVIKRQSWSRLVPGPLLAVGASIVINELYRVVAPGLYIAGEDGHLVDLPVLRSWADVQLAIPSPDFAGTPITGDVLLLAFTIAAVASIETLLCVEATDKLDPFKRTSPTNRELIAQGVGNTVSGLLGGLPMTAVIVRSSANTYAGGRTRASAWYHGALLLGLVVAVPVLLNKIPLGALAAVLLVVGYKLARVSLFKQMWKAGLDQFLPFIVTIVATVLTDLLIGVSIGFVVGVTMVFLTNFHTAIAVTREGKDVHIQFVKDVSFLNKSKLKQALASVEDGATVTIDGSAAGFLDRDILETIKDFEASAKHRSLTVHTLGLDTERHPLARRKGPNDSARAAK